MVYKKESCLQDLSVPDHLPYAAVRKFILNLCLLSDKHIIIDSLFFVNIVHFISHFRFYFVVFNESFLLFSLKNTMIFDKISNFTYILSNNPGIPALSAVS